VFVGRFPVGARADDDTTVWHTVLAFGERAKKLEGTLQKGEIVEVVGYVHERQQRRRDGTTKQVSELYAVAVRRR
jgi:single-stranded DNA-binding protein